MKSTKEKMNDDVCLMKKNGKAAHAIKIFPATFFRVNTLFLNYRNRIISANKVRRFILFIFC